MSNRIIKFRAWDAKRKSFVEEFNITEDGNCFRINAFETCEPLDVIVSQFTGLQDRNGKDIYEGDIVNWQQAHGGVMPPDQTAYKCIIRWDDFMNGWRCIRTDIPDRYLTLASCHITVIGNIHENSHLLN